MYRHAYTYEGICRACVVMCPWMSLNVLVCVLIQGMGIILDEICQHLSVYLQSQYLDTACTMCIWIISTGSYVYVCMYMHAYTHAHTHVYVCFMRTYEHYKDIIRTYKVMFAGPETPKWRGTCEAQRMTGRVCYTRLLKSPASTSTAAGTHTHTHTHKHTHICTYTRVLLCVLACVSTYVVYAPFIICVHIITTHIIIRT